MVFSVDFMRLKIIFFVITAMFCYSCNKSTIDPSPASIATVKFTNKDSIPTYIISSTADSFKIPIEVSTIVNVDRVVRFTYSSSTALAGQHYLAPSSIIISAGKMKDSLVIKGLFSGFNCLEVDTLNINIIASDDFNPNTTNSNFQIILKRSPLDELLGVYTHTTDIFPTDTLLTDPYITSVSTVNYITPTSGTLFISDIYDLWPPLNFILDWTDELHKTLTVLPQDGLPYGNGETCDIRPFPSGNLGDFSICENLLTLKMQVRINSGPWLDTPYVVYLSR